MRKDFLQELALAKIEDANLLLENERYANAYYLYGYGIELALKAVIAGQFRADEIPDKKLVLGIYTHDLEQLVFLAGLKEELAKACKEDKKFASSWDNVKRWSEQSRYQRRGDLAALVMQYTIEDPDIGVMQWVQSHW